MVYAGTDKSNNIRPVASGCFSVLRRSSRRDFPSMRLAIYCELVVLKHVKRVYLKSDQGVHRLSNLTRRYSTIVTL